MAGSNYLLSNGATVTAQPVGSATAALNIGQPEQITMSGSALTLEDITNLASPGNYKEYAAAQLDAGDVELTCVYDPADVGQASLIAAFDGMTKLNVVVQFPKGTDETTAGPKLAFTAYVKSRPQRSLSTAKAVKFVTQLKITGPITETAGS